MPNISGKTYEKIGIETIVDNDGILRLSKKYIEEGLDHKNLGEITTKYHSDHRKYKFALVKEPKKRCNRIFMHKKIAVKVIIDSRATSAQKFRARSRLTQNDVILTKEKSVLPKRTSSFEGKKICKQNILILN